MKKTGFIGLFFLLVLHVFPQADSVIENENEISEAEKLRMGTTVTAIVIGNDTIPVINLPVFRIMDVRNFKNKKEEKNYYRLKRDVLKVYPYAKLAGEKLRLYNDTLLTIQSEKLRKKFLKKVEEELKNEFTDDLEDMTINQGRILIRLIDRQTGNTSYHLVEELRGTFSAFFWQSIARLFGHNLKTRYNPKQGEDKTIEEIVLLIENGDYK